MKIITKCPNIESFYIKDLRVNLTKGGLFERNLVVINRLFNDCIKRCCTALKSASRLRVLRYLFLNYSANKINIWSCIFFTG